MKNKLLWHQVVLIGVLLLITALRLLIGRWTISSDILWWWLGSILGFIFVFSDRFINILITNPKDAMSLKLKDLWRGGKAIEAFSLTVTERANQTNLVMRSALFTGAWIILAIWTMTSVSNVFSRGFIYGIGLHLVFDLWWDYYIDKASKIRDWFWQIKRDLSEIEIKQFVFVVGGVFLLISYFI